VLKWPERAKPALRKLFEPLQEIDVYVEDMNDEAFYRALLNSSTNGEIKVARVFALGCREAVIDGAKTHDQQTRRALFIIDGDLAWVRGDPPLEVAGLHCHDAYCIENLIICERALILILSQDAILTEEESEVRLAYGKWEASVETPLIELFAAFATVNKLDPTVPTVSQGVGAMCVADPTARTTELDPTKVGGARDKALKAAEGAVDSEVVSATYSLFLNRLKGLRHPLRAVSGKDFLLPLIDLHLRALGCRIKRKSLRLRLASAGDLTRFASLATALREAAEGHL